MTRPAHLPAPSYTQTPSRFTREEAKTWKTWLEDDNGTNPDKGRFTCSGPVSYGGRPGDLDELYERMVARGVCAATTDGSGTRSDTGRRRKYRRRKPRSV